MAHRKRVLPANPAHGRRAGERQGGWRRLARCRRQGRPGGSTRQAVEGSRARSWCCCCTCLIVLTLHRSTLHQLSRCRRSRVRWFLTCRACASFLTLRCPVRCTPCPPAAEGQGRVFRTGAGGLPGAHESGEPALLLLLPLHCCRHLCCCRLCQGVRSARHHSVQQRAVATCHSNFCEAPPPHTRVQVVSRALRNAQHRQDASRRSADVAITGDPRRIVTQVRVIAFPVCVCGGGGVCVCGGGGGACGLAACGALRACCMAEQGWGAPVPQHVGAPRACKRAGWL